MKLEDIDKMLGEITQGEWKYGTDPCHYDAPEVGIGDGAFYIARDADARFIAAAPKLVRELVERVRVLEKRKVVSASVLDQGDRLVGGRNPFTPGYPWTPPKRS